MNNGLEQKAQQARANTPDAVRALTDEIFAQTPLSQAAESLRDRVARCELAFRHGTHAAVDETSLASVINEHVREFKGGPSLETNRSQIQTIRGFRRRSVPSFVEPRGPKEHGLATAMSPAEAVYVTLNLGIHKLMNPDYQVTPAEWDRRAASRRADKEPHEKKPHARLVGSTVSPDAAALQLRVEQDIRSEGSEVVERAHAFLDRLGFQR